MKQGEQEAKEILERKGIAFDDSHEDDGTKHSLPDLKYLGEDRYLEVTHTYHNHRYLDRVQRFYSKSSEEQCAISEDAAEALDRIMRAEYPDTLEGHALFRQDRKKVKKHMGYDPTEFSFSNKLSEFDCDLPIIRCSDENILREVAAKGKNHNSGNTDLFIFVLKDEFEAMMYVLRSGSENGCYGAFYSSLLHSPFPVVYVCVWDFESQTYETEDPVIMKFEKTDDGGIRAKRI